MLPENHLERKIYTEDCFIFVILFLVDRWNALLFYKTITAAKINNCTVVICLQNQINQLVLLNNLIIIYFFMKKKFI
jgi:hypothetical protein